MVNTPTINRRRFFKRLGLVTAASLLAGAVDARFLEPHWLKIRKLRLSTAPPVCRFAYFTDVHYKGDRAFVQSVVDTLNALNLDFACFGGDLIEDVRYLPAALEILSGIKVPLYGVPGNHDYWSHASFEPYKKCFAATGGAWLMDEHRDLAGGKVRLTGLSCKYTNPPKMDLNPSAKNIVLMHYPAWVEKLTDQPSDLMLAGHSHGGQFRLPFIGSLVVPFNVEQYDLGWFQTKAGPLYVNPGIGWLYLNVRFNCRPEITVFEV